MILPDRYLFKKLTEAKSRFDCTESSESYDFFESLLINKRCFNVGGLSLNLCPQPETHSGKPVDHILCKGSHSITKVKKPDIESHICYGDVAGTMDGLIIVYNQDYKETGITSIEIFIARGCRNDTLGLYTLFTEGELSHEVEALRKKAVTKIVTMKGE